VSWAWYSGGWNVALADGRQPPAVKRQMIYTRNEGSPMFQPHHQPFNYYERFAPARPIAPRTSRTAKTSSATSPPARCPP
jgi:phospholipase C